ncbi:MAG: hypothetical protein QHH06_07325 [Clostridiales bacterium]|jgi:hypothetical protein|nr:hypothetical protein [Eubacteriales bacterium]MDH7566279.1 hypothetical protein [Clostridiales bacterium]
MANKRDKTNIRDERIEDVTMYGEFISSFDQWVTPDRQKKMARYLEEITQELAPDRKGSKSEEKRSN